MAKLPSASVQLAWTLVPGRLEGLNPAMIVGLVGSVTSVMVIRVAFLKPVIALRPRKVTGPVTIGLPLGSTPEALVGSSRTVLGITSGASLMANEPRP